MHILDFILPTMEHIHILGYWVAFLFALCETIIGIGLFIPGSTALLIMGAMAAGGNLDIGDLIFFAVCGAIIGDNINYYIGRKFGSRIFLKGFWLIKIDHLNKGKKFLDDHGAKSIFLGRFIPSIKEITPLVAGTLKMEKLIFIFWNILGAIGWSLVWILPGYFFAQSLDTAQLWLSRSGFLLFVIFIFLALFYILKYVFIKKGQIFLKILKSLWNSIKSAIVNNSDVKGYIDRHQKIFIFLKNRLNKNEFFGRTLTLLLIVFVYILFLFGGIIEDFLNSDIITSFDVRVSHLLFLFRDSELIKIFLWITVLGKWQVFLVFLFSLALILVLIKKRYYIIPLLASAGGGVVLNYLSKIIFHRPRPETPVYLEKSFSFPSGHATIAVALYGFIAYIFIRETKSWRTKVNIFFGGVLLAVLIGFSRIYLGVHYVSDIWSGYLLGALCLIIGISITEYQFSRYPQKQLTGYKDHKIIIWAAFIFGLIFYSIFAYNYNPPILNLPTDKREGRVKIKNVMDIFGTDQLRYSETLTGIRQEPINFVIIAKDDNNLIKAFSRAGWYLANRIDINSVSRIAEAAILKKPYNNAPMTPSFWDTQTHDFGFEKPTEADNVRQRHHARFWRSNYINEQGYNIYIGTASFDEGVKWGITHKISPDIDTERELIFNDLQNANVIKSYAKEKIVNPVLGINFAGDQFFTDGNMYIIQLVSDN